MKKLFTEEELKGNKHYRFVGAGILQRGACGRDLHEPSHYDKWFDTYEECMNYIYEIEDLGYGNTISGPYPLYEEIITDKDYKKFLLEKEVEFLNQLLSIEHIAQWIQVYITYSNGEIDEMPIKNPNACCWDKDIIKECTSHAKWLVSLFNDPEIDYVQLWTE